MFCGGPIYYLIMVLWMRIFAGWLIISTLSILACSHRIGAEAGQATVVLPASSAAKNDHQPAPNKRVKVASLRRTPCFGSCPVFAVEVWSDGQVTWQGEKNVARLGAYTAHVPAAWIAELMQEAEQSGFFQLANHYPTNGRPVPDLPETILTLRRGNAEHHVTDNADAPLGLLRFERYWQEKLEMLTWKRVAQ